MDPPNEVVLREFERHEDSANIYSKPDPSMQSEIVGILPNIDNRVDMTNQFSLRDLYQHDSDT